MLKVETNRLLFSGVEDFWMLDLIKISELIGYSACFILTLVNILKFFSFICAMDLNVFIQIFVHLKLRKMNQLQKVMIVSYLFFCQE